MTYRKILLLGALVFLLALFGCSAPQYQFCCFYEDAFPEDPADAVCRGLNESGEYETIPVISCDEDEWSCIIPGEGGEDRLVPVCPNILTTKCNSSCVGVFCGNFFYDPRPPYGTVPGDEAHAAPDEAKNTQDSALSEPIGLWKAECRTEEMTPLFMRQVDNSDNIVMNTFRFGVGSSFQDFENAQLYFPITDQACAINTMGTVDRYVLYAIPNQRSDQSGWRLCRAEEEYVSLSPLPEPTGEGHKSFAEKASVLRGNGACTSNMHCPPGEACHQGICVDACTVVQCAFEEHVCIGGYCVPPGMGLECNVDGDCGDGEVCINGYCNWDLQLSGCTKNLDCPPGRVCYAGQCIDACSQAMCMGDEICVDGYCVPPKEGEECEEGKDCELWEACANGYCRWSIYSDQWCYIDEHCPQGKECHEGDCFTPCTSDEDCGGKEECSDQGYCIALAAECGSDADCDSGEKCEEGICVPGLVLEIDIVQIEKRLVYTCTAFDMVKSYNYFDCASRCALYLYGYKAEIEPFNPYLSIYNDERVGNPFAYAPTSKYPEIYNGVEPYSTYRDKVGPLPAWGTDNYAFGTVLYGATFGQPLIGNDGHYHMLQLLSYQGHYADDSDSKHIPQFGGHNTIYGQFYHFNWNWDGQSYAQTAFTTLENSPHEFYPWLLAHHSVYNKQFKEGHFKPDGTYATGAEFECNTGMDCLSGYCNQFDYKRGACVGVNGEDILCDCEYVNGQTLCTGMGTTTIPSWDYPSVQVEVPVALSAAVDFARSAKKGGQQTIAYLPSLGGIVQYNIPGAEELELDFGAGPEELSTAPMLVFHLGGGKTSSFFGNLNVPDYTLNTWGDVGNDRISRIVGTIDICSARKATRFSVTYEGTKYVYCCDGTTTCGTDEEKEDEDTEIRAYQNRYKLLTRFVDNCMDGYQSTHISVCYSPDARDTDRAGIWGWSGSSPVFKYLEEDILKSVGDGEFEYRHPCDWIGNLDDGQRRRCYQWESGGHYPIGDGDTCVAESESYMVIEPRRVEVGGVARWAYGNCLLNSQGTELEIREYGICESCGYLTMAKQEITSFPLEPEPTFDPIAQSSGLMYGNTYCPDMVIHTPHNWDSLEQQTGKENAPFGDYTLAPTGMSGYNAYEFGNYVWGTKECTYPNGYTVNEGIYRDQRGLPYTNPNAFYINRKLESFMKRNIQPVIFATDDNLWTTRIYFESGDEREFVDLVGIGVDESTGNVEWSTNTLMKTLFQERGYLFETAERDEDSDPGTTAIYTIGSFLGNTIINEGGAIIVIGDYAQAQSEDVSLDQFEARAKAVRLLCPNCMVAISAGYPPWDFRLSETTGKNVISFFEGQAVGENVDTYALNIVLKDNDDFCEIQNEGQRFEAILGNLTQTGINNIKATGKPLVITDFVIDRSGTCWTEHSAGRLMAYLGANSHKLASAGYLGLIYGEWMSTKSDATGIVFASTGTPLQVAHYRGQFFSGMFTAARNFAGHDFLIFYNEAVVSEKCECIPCGPGDKFCNGRYQGTGPLCDNYEPGTKWPEICVRHDVCKYTSPLIPTGQGPFGSITFSGADYIVCDVLHNDGSKETIDFPIDKVRENPSIYRDVIGSLEAHTPFCFVSSDGGAITYLKSEQSGYAATPMVFPKDGDQSIQCDPTAGLLDSFCGYYPPLSNYRMSCRFSKGGSGPDGIEYLPSWQTDIGDAIVDAQLVEI